MPYFLSRTLSVVGRFGLIALATSVIGCGGGRYATEEQTGPQPTPVGLILEKQISGRILGQVIKAPAGVTVDRRGTLFLVDRGSNRVIWFSADLRPLRSIDGATTRGGLFDEPSSVTVDEDLNVWVADAGNRRLVQYSEFLEFIDEIDLYDDNAPHAFGHPGSVAVSRFGEVYVTDTDSDRIAVLDTFGDIERFLGDFGHPGGGLDEPGGLMIDRHDHLYVCDVGNQRVMLYDDRGGVIRELTDESFYEPSAVTIDRIGRVWILDRATSQVHCFSSEGQLVSTVGPMISGMAVALRNPSGLAFTIEGFLVISDTGNDRVLICRVMYENQD